MNGETEAKIARIDERTKYIKENLEKFVTKDEFLPVKRIVYGLVGAILTAVVLGGLALIIT